MLVDQYHSFFKSSYQAFVKSNITLEQRYQFADLIASIARHHSSERWQQIEKNAQRFNSAIEYLNHNGFLVVKLPFVSQIVNEILALSKSQIQVENIPISTKNEIFHLKDVQSLPSIKKLLEFNHLYELVSMYLGCPASLYACQAWWQFPTDLRSSPQNTQLWHRDRDDFRFLKLFINITDVDLDSGPHSFIQYSHRPGNSNSIYSNYELDKHMLDGQHQRFLCDDAMNNLLSTYSPKIWTGPAGVSFLEDTRGFHKASIPTQRPRLILSVIWTIKPREIHNSNGNHLFAL